MKEKIDFKLIVENLMKSPPAIQALVEEAFEQNLIDSTSKGHIYWSSCGEYLDKEVKEGID